SQRRQRRLVVQTPGKGRRDRNDGPAGCDRKIHPCCTDAVLALADLRHGGAADYSFSERILHSKRKLLGAAIEAPLRPRIVSCQERCQWIAAPDPEQCRQQGWRGAIASEYVSFPKIITARSGDAIRTRLARL